MALDVPPGPRRPDTPGRGPALPQASSGRSAPQVARRCAREASRIMMAGLGFSPIVARKGRGNLVTEADLAVERAVQEILAVEYPDHRLLAEEGQAPWPAPPEGLGGWVWVLDPLDGTRNYASAIPLFCFNLALCYDGEPLLALTYDPLRREEFSAVKGGGAWLSPQATRRPPVGGLAVARGGGRRRLGVSAKASLQAAVVGLDLGYDDQRARHLLALLCELWPGVQGVRVIGSGALGLAYVASGRYDLYVHHCLYPWDIAAGILLVREAGGIITDRDGGPIGLDSQGVVAGAPGVHADFLRRAQGWPWR